MVVTLGQQYSDGEKPAVMYTLTGTLIAMQGHQTKQHDELGLQLNLLHWVN